MDGPNPPASRLDLSKLSGFGIRLTPAPEAWGWLSAEILADTGSIHNEARRCPPAGCGHPGQVGIVGLRNTGCRVFS